MIYRMRYTKDSNFYRVHIVEGCSRVAGFKSTTRPKIARVRAFLEENGFEAYGDMLRLGDGSYVSMLRKVGEK